MYHTLAWFSALGVAAANTKLNAVTGTAETIQNNNHVLKKRFKLEAFYYGAASATRARINSPSLKELSFPQIRPINLTLLPATNYNIADYKKDSFYLEVNEEQQLEGSNSLGAATENSYGVAFIGDGMYNLPMGDKETTLIATGTTTLAASVWTNVPLTFSENLPEGRYAVVGMEVISATGIAARLVFPLRELWRPGVICQASLGGKSWEDFVEGGLGSMGEFTSVNLPSVEILANAADTVQTVFLKVRRVARSAGIPS